MSLKSLSNRKKDFLIFVAGFVIGIAIFWGLSWLAKNPNNSGSIFYLFLFIRQFAFLLFAPIEFLSSGNFSIPSLSFLHLGLSPLVFIQIVNWFSIILWGIIFGVFFLFFWKLFSKLKSLVLRSRTNMFVFSIGFIIGGILGRLLLIVDQDAVVLPCFGKYILIIGRYPSLIFIAFAIFFWGVIIGSLSLFFKWFFVKIKTKLWHRV